MKNVVIVAYARSPFTPANKGALMTVRADDLTAQVVKALIATVMADNKIAVSEMELLRVVCSVIHVPLPMITGGEVG